MDLFKLFAKKNDKNRIRLTRSETGDWMVQKGFSILYIGSREKCEIFMRQALGA